METCRPQQSIHVDQFFVSRLSTKKSKAKRKKKRLVRKKKNDNTKKKCLQEQRLQFNRKRRDNCMLSDAKNGEIIKNYV